MRTKTFLLITFILAFGFSKAQVDITYQKPPKEILELADAPQTPSVLIDDESENIVLIYRNKYKSIRELSEPEMRLAGLRINPATNIGSRTRFYNDLSLMKVGDRYPKEVESLPEEPRLSHFS